MEIYCISLSIGVWQLGSACSYVIYTYCDILRRIYSVLEYLGLSEESSAKCSLLQVALPGNLIIICASLLLLLVTFFFQALSQYKKNIKDSLRYVDAGDLPILSMAWSYNSSKNSRDSTISLETEVVSDHSQQTIHSSISAQDTNPPAIEGSKCLDATDESSPQTQQEIFVSDCSEGFRVHHQLKNRVECDFSAADQSCSHHRLS